jgi:hypothetical protein
MSTAAALTTTGEYNPADALSFSDAVDDALRALDAVLTGADALRALTGRKRDQLAELIERGNTLLAETEEDADEEEPDDDDGLELELAFAGHAARLRT